MVLDTFILMKLTCTMFMLPILWFMKYVFPTLVWVENFVTAKYRSKAVINENANVCNLTTSRIERHFCPFVCTSDFCHHPWTIRIAKLLIGLYLNWLHRKKRLTIVSPHVGHLHSAVFICRYHRHLDIPTIIYKSAYKDTAKFYCS